MKTLTGLLPLKYRSAVRFVCVGIIGTGLQYGIYYMLSEFFHREWPDVAIMTSVAFTIGFVIELVYNYILTSYYTFRVRPSMKNAGGFLFGRAINYVIQLFFLNILLWLHISKDLSGFMAIVLAGIINYFVLLPFYREKRGNSQKK